MPQLDKFTYLTQFFWLCLFFFSFYIFICNDGNGVLGISRIRKLRNPLNQHLKDPRILHFWGFRLVLSILAMIVAGFFGQFLEKRGIFIFILGTSFLLFLCSFFFHHYNIVKKKNILLYLPLYIGLLFWVYIEISLIRIHILPGVGRGLAAVLVLCIGEGLVPSNPSSYIENAPSPSSGASSSSVNQPRAAERVDLYEEDIELNNYPLALQKITQSFKQLCCDPTLREHFPLLDFEELHCCPLVKSMLHSYPFYIRTLPELDEITDMFCHGSDRDQTELKKQIFSFFQRRFPDYYVRGSGGTELHRSETYFPDQRR